MRMYLIIFLSVICPAEPIFSHYLINGKIFAKKLQNIKCILIFSAFLSETCIILRTIQRDTINVHRSSCKVPVIKKKGKAIPLQTWTGPEGSRRLRLPDFKTIGT